MAFGSLLGFRQQASGGTPSNPNTNVRRDSGSGSWDSGFESSDYLPANTTGSVKFTAKVTGNTGTNNQYLMVGFSRSSDTPAAGFAGIRYAAYLRYTGSGSNHAMRVFESGSQVYSETAITDGDIMSVHRDGGTGAITYKLNGSTIYTSAVTDTSELKIDGTFLNLDNRALDILLDNGTDEFNPFYQNKVLTLEY
jgi:hypothetical protein